MVTFFKKRIKFWKDGVRGFGLIEIVIGSAVLAVSLLAVSFYFQQSLSVSQRTSNVVQAAFLMEEGVEVVKFFHGKGWTNISDATAGTPYFLTWTGSTWSTTTTNVFIDSLFERKLVFDNVYRDSNDDVVASGGTLDTGTRKVTVSVAWNYKGATTTKSVSTYLANIFN